MDLFKAFSQWSTRPNDERFESLEDMQRQCEAYRRASRTSSVNLSEVRIEADDGDLRLVGKTGASAAVSNYAFGQLAQRAGAPAAYLRKLPPTLAAQNVNHGLKQRAADGDDAKLLFTQRNGDARDMLLRASLSNKYSRIWNHELVERLVPMQSEGWRAPPARPARDDPRARPATEADVLRNRNGILSVKVGDLVAPAGLYASDRDMFAFLINEESVVDDGTPEGLSRFVMLWNSEVGDSSLGLMCGLYKAVCGNHIVWGASNVSEVRVRHVGDDRRVRAKAFGRLSATITRYADSSTSDQQATIASARTLELGATKEEVVEAVTAFGRSKRITALTAARVGDAFDAAEKHRDWYNVAPTTVWGVVQGMTEVAQTEKHTDARTAIDRASGRVMEMAF